MRYPSQMNTTLVTGAPVCIDRATYQHVDGRSWRSTGFIMARPARPSETIDTLEGRAAAGVGAWIVRREGGEQWPASAEEFRGRYEGPV